VLKGVKKVRKDKGKMSVLMVVTTDSVTVLGAL
jgi:hypothetical protein